MTDVYAGRLIEAEDNLDVATRQDDNIRIFFFSTNWRQQDIERGNSTADAYGRQENVEKLMAAKRKWEKDLPSKLKEIFCCIT